MRFPILIRYLFLLSVFSLIMPCAYAEVKWLSTGVGLDQRQNQHPDFSLKLVFFVSTGAYLANIDVKISGPGDTQILSTNSKGPWLFVLLSPGQYKVVAERKNGDQQSVDFLLSPGTQKTVSLMFPDR